MAQEVDDIYARHSSAAYDRNAKKLKLIDINIIT